MLSQLFQLCFKADLQKKSDLSLVVAGITFSSFIKRKMTVAILYTYPHKSRDLVKGRKSNGDEKFQPRNEDCDSTSHEGTTQLCRRC